MIHAGDICEDPITGERVTFPKTSAETEGRETVSMDTAREDESPVGERSTRAGRGTKESIPEPDELAGIGRRQAGVAGPAHAVRSGAV